MLRSKCSDFALQKRSGRKMMASTVGAGRKPRTPITDIVGLFDTVKSAEGTAHNTEHDAQAHCKIILALLWLSQSQLNDTTSLPH